MRARALRGPIPEIRWVAHEEKREFVLMLAAPCPLLGTDVDGQALCTIHSIRPYNCRRFGCLRPDPRTEVYEICDDGRWGCKNLIDRVKSSRVARRTIELIQRRAQKWALKHGWDQNS